MSDYKALTDAFVAADEQGDTALATRLASRIRRVQKVFTPEEYDAGARIAGHYDLGRTAEGAREAWTLSTQRVRQQRSRAPTGRLETAARSFANVAGFGLGDPISGAVSTVGDVIAGRVDSPAEAFDAFKQHTQDESNVRRGLESDNPVSALAGGVAGGVASLPRAVTSAAPLAALAVQGGVTGAVNAASATQGDIAQTAQGGAAGATMGVVAGKVVQAAAPQVLGAVQRVNDRLSESNGLRAFAAQLDVPVAAVQREYDNFVTRFGAPPALVQLKSAVEAARAGGRLISDRAAASSAADAGAETLRQRQSGLLTDSVLPGRTQNANLATEAVTAQFDRIRNAQIRVGSEGTRTYSLLVHPDVMEVSRGLSATDRQAFAEAVEEGGTITVQQLDNLRQALRDAAGPGTSHGYYDLADRVTALADNVTRGRYSQTLGFQGRVAARDAIASKAAASPAGAEAAARDLAVNVDPQLALRTTLGRVEQGATPQRAVQIQAAAAAESAGLRDAGQQTLDAAQGVRAFRPNQVRSEVQDAEETAQLVGALTASAAGKPAFGIVRLVKSALRHVQMGDNGAEDLARMLTDPNRTQDVIDFLRQRGLSKAASRQTAAKLAQLVARESGPVAANAVLETAQTQTAPAAAAAPAPGIETSMANNGAQVQQLNPEDIATLDDAALEEAFIAADDAAQTGDPQAKLDAIMYVEELRARRGR